METVQGESGAEHTARIKARYLREVNRSISRFSHTWRIVILILMGCSFVLMPVALLLAQRLLLRTEEEELFLSALRRGRKFGRRATPVIAFPLMVNFVLRMPGAERSGALVIVTFDTSPEVTTGFMAGLAVALSRGGGSEGQAGRWTKEQREFARVLMEDEEYQPSRRRRIPVEMTGGRVAYACDLMVEPDLLPGGYLSDDLLLLPCMAEPGDRGGICLLPYWMAGAPEEPATAPQLDAFEASLMYLEATRRAAKQRR